MKTLAGISPIRRIDDIRAPVGVAHAYDAMHLLARSQGVATLAQICRREFGLPS